MNGVPNNATLFARRVLLASGLVAMVAVLVYLVALLRDVFLLVFAGILIAVVIDGVTRLIDRYLPLARIWSLLLAFLLILVLLVGAAAIIGPQAAQQLPEVAEQIPAAVQQLLTILQQIPGGKAVIEEADQAARFIDQELLARILGIFSSAFGAVGSFLLILLIGIYTVLSPGMYIDGVVRLVPPSRRERIREVLTAQGRALRLWLLSRLVSMIFVGVGVGAGLLLFGVPMAFALGLIAGLFTFIPYLGPILGAIPTILIALLEGPEAALYAALLYFGIEMLEGNIITPVATQQVIELPPMYTVVIQVAGGILAGVTGIILATPLAVVVVVAVQMLYIEDFLGDKVSVLGKGKDGSA